MPKDEKKSNAGNDPGALEDNTNKETKEANAVQDKKNKKVGKFLTVVAKREVFRRAGFTFGSEPTTLLVSDLSEIQIKQLKEEKMLVVTENMEEV